MLFGATRVKGLAKALGEGVSEYKKATSETPAQEDEKQTIIQAAKKIGIETEGKNIKQIIKEINERVA